MLLQNAFLDTSVFYLHHVFSNGSHERAWLKKDVHAVQVITVLEVADAEMAKRVEAAIRANYPVISGPYGITN